MSDLTFLTRDRCLLCVEALAVVEEQVRRRRHTVRIIDVDSDPTLRDRYGDRVPVVLRDGSEVLAGAFTPRAVRRALR
ncbi:MAG: glutaredoxin family protein [Acidimicrobiia bacterium]